MSSPRPVRGSTSIINEQSATIKEQLRAINQLRDESNHRFDLVVMVLRDYERHACVTDDTLRVLQREYDKTMGEMK